MVAPHALRLIWLLVIAAIGEQLRALRMPGAMTQILLDPRRARMRAYRRKCELHLIDFVEMFWSVVDTEQPFVRGWVQEAICAHLEAISRGRITKLLVNVPPGFTKSKLVNVFWPAWEWGPRNRPDLRYISWSYSPKLTMRDNDECRKIMESALYREWWGDRFSFDETSNAKAFYKNDKGGFRVATSIAGTGTGLRADRLIWDDPHKAQDADRPNALELATRWFSRTLPTRVRNASDQISRVRVPFWVRDAHGITDDAADDAGMTDEDFGLFDTTREAAVAERERVQKLAGKDGLRKATISATVGIMQRIHLHDISGIILENPDLGYEVLLIEMEWKGAEHPARQHKNWRASSIDYVDRRVLYDAVAATIADVEGDDPYDDWLRAWRAIGLDYAKLADPVRFPREAVEDLKRNLVLVGGSDAIAAQLDQWPVEQGGNWFANAADKIIQVHECPVGSCTDERGFDLASGETAKAAQTASVKIRTGLDKRIYIRHSSAMRGGPAAVDRWFQTLHKLDEPSVEWSIPEDPGSGGKHVAAYHKRVNAPGRVVRSSPERGSKRERAKPISAQFNGDNVRIVAHDGVEQLVRELTDFPYGDFCDLVDALSRAYEAQLIKPMVTESHGGELIETGGELFE